MQINRLGIDLSQDFLDLYLVDAQGHPCAPGKRFTHNLPGSQAARQYILAACQTHPADQLWIAAEATGLYGWHLFQDWQADPQLAALQPLFYLLNPAHVKGFRHALSQQDKVDPKDAPLIARYLGVPDLHLHPWPADLASWPLRFLTRFRCRLAHHLAQLKGATYTWIYLKASAFPQVQPFQNLFGKTSLELLCQAPSLEPLLQLSTEELAETIARLGRGGFRDPLESARQVQQAARCSYPLDPATAQVVHFALQQSVELIRELEKHLRATDRRIAELVQGDADIANLDSIGGLGGVYAAGLAAEIRPTQRFLQGEKYDLRSREWRPRTLWDAQAAVAKLAGLWWPRRASGQFEGQDRHMPAACNAYLRYYLVEAAQHVREHVPEYQAYYQRKYHETRKHPHQRALVLTARKLERLVFILLHKHETYQPRRWPKA